MFGGASAAPSFNEIPTLGGRKLPMPMKTDSLAQLADKMDDLRQVIQNGGSLAVATGLMGTVRQTADPLEYALQEMSTTEKEQYDMWINGARLLDFDKKKSVDNRDKWRGNDKSLNQWLVGLRAMYDDESLTAEHVVWYAANASFMVPTIMAFCKVKSAERALTIKGKDLSPAELAEYQTSKKVLAEAAFRVQEIKKILNAYTSRIDKAEQVVLTRLRHYEDRIKEKPRGDAPLNRERARRGMPALRGPSNLSSLGKRSRAEIREELGRERPPTNPALQRSGAQRVPPWGGNNNDGLIEPELPIDLSGNMDVDLEEALGVAGQASGATQRG